MSRWELTRQPELIAVEIDAETRKKHVVEIAKVLYQILCQLDPRFQNVASPIEPELPKEENRR